MVTNRIIFYASKVLPNPDEIDYWIDLNDNPYGGVIRYFNGTEWIELSATSGLPDLSNYYTKPLVNTLLNGKASVESVESKVDDAEVKDVVKDIRFNNSSPNNTTMVLFRYDGSNSSVTLPIASSGTAGIVTSQDFIDFVKQHQLLELHTEMIDLLADIRSKYQKKLIAGKNIYIDKETNVISATGDLSVKWDLIIEKPDFKPVATSGSYNDLIDKLKGSSNVTIDSDNVIDLVVRGGSLLNSLDNLNQKIEDETDRAALVESNLSTNLLNEVTRSTLKDRDHDDAISKEVEDRKAAIADEVLDRNAAIKVETDRAKAAEEALGARVDKHTTDVNSALTLKADKSDTYTKEQVDVKVSGVYKIKGSSTFESLPTTNIVGDVYNITNGFTLNGDHYDPGTNLVWTADGWDPLSGSFDTTAIENSIGAVALDLAQEVIDRIEADKVVLQDANDYADDRVRVGTEATYDSSVILIDDSIVPLEVEIYSKPQVDDKLSKIDTRIDGVDTRLDNIDADIVDINTQITTGFTSVNNDISILNDDLSLLDVKLDNKVTLSSTTLSPTDLMVDENATLEFRVYTKAEVDSIIEKLKSDNNLI